MTTDRDALELDYALAKQVPAMRSGVTLDTNYGALVLDGDDAAQVAALVERLLEARLATRERAARDALDG